MKRSDENRYPHSANLFRFCKEALNIKHNFEVKVIDQHVGALLGYDPADCSHWKKGKKNIRSIQTISTIASHLEIDPRFVADIVSGKLDLEESIQEFKGYGPFALTPHQYDELRREYYKSRSHNMLDSEAKPFEEILDQQREAVRALAHSITTAAQVKSCPVLLPELTEVLQGIRIQETEMDEGNLVLSRKEGQTTVIFYRKGVMKPHLRFLIAREIGRALLANHPTPLDHEDLQCARLNLFASFLLMPAHLLPFAAHEASHTRDLLQQLSEYFWVSRTIVNARLKDFFVHGN